MNYRLDISGEINHCPTVEIRYFWIEFWSYLFVFMVSIHVLVGWLIIWIIDLLIVRLTDWWIYVFCSFLVLLTSLFYFRIKKSVVFCFVFFPYEPTVLSPITVFVYEPFFFRLNKLISMYKSSVVLMCLSLICLVSDLAPPSLCESCFLMSSVNTSMLMPLVPQKTSQNCFFCRPSAFYLFLFFSFFKYFLYIL